MLTYADVCCAATGIGTGRQRRALTQVQERARHKCETEIKKIDWIGLDEIRSD